MPERVQVKDLYKDRGYLPGVQPTARPVDTFVAPATPKQDIRLLELARAFQDIQPGLRQFAQERIAVANEAEVAEGRKAALENKAQFKQAIDKGMIPPGASPWFRVGYERQRAARVSMEYDQALRSSYAETDLANSDDPNAVSSWMQDFTKKWLEANPEAQANPEFGRVFGVLGAQAQDQLQSQHAAERTKRIEEGLVSDTDFMLSSSIDRAILPDGSRNPTLGQELATTLGEQVANGLNGTVANRLVTDAVIRKAEETGDITLLDTLDEVPAGSGVVGKIGWVKDKVDQARANIARGQHERDRLANLKAEADKKIAIQGLQSAANEKLFADPFGADVSEEQAKLNLLDPDEALKLSSWRTTLVTSLSSSARIIEDPQVRTGLTLQAINGELTNDQVIQAVADRQIDADTAKSLLTDLIPKAKEHKAIIEMPVIRRASGDIRKVIVGNELSDNFKNDRYELAAQADEMFQVGILQWAAENPKEAKDIEKVLNKASSLRKAILETPGFLPDAEPLPDIKGDLEKQAQENAPVKVNADTAKSQFLFKSVDDMNAALAEAAQTKGQSGRLKELADLYKIDVAELAAAQKALLRSKQPK
jgi:hypothetical protein